MPLLLDAARAHATEGEIVNALQDVWGNYPKPRLRACRPCDPPPRSGNAPSCLALGS